MGNVESITVFALVFCALAISAQNSAPTADQLMTQAKAAYRAKLYSDSAALLTRALTQVTDFERPQLEYLIAI